MRIAPAVIVLLLLSGVAGCSGLDRLNQARTEANESSAIASVRAVVSAQLTYSAFCGGSYAPTLPALLSKGYIGSDLGGSDQPSKAGYHFRMSAVRGDGTTPCGDVYSDFEVRAEPDTQGSSGARYFRASSSGEVFAATKPDFSNAVPLQ